MTEMAGLKCFQTAVKELLQYIKISAVQDAWKTCVSVTANIFRQTGRCSTSGMQHLILQILTVMEIWIFFPEQKMGPFIFLRTSVAEPNRFIVWVASLRFSNTWIFVQELRWPTL